MDYSMHSGHYYRALECKILQDTIQVCGTIQGLYGFPAMQTNKQDIVLVLGWVSI